MTKLKFGTVVLFLLSTYALCECSKLVGKKVNLAKEKGDLGKATPAAAVAGVLKDATITSRQKRSQSEFINSNEYRDLNEIIDDIEDNAVATALTPNTGVENMSPLIYHLILQKLKQLQANEQGYRVLTPRLGRSIDFRHLDSAFGGFGTTDDGVGGSEAGTGGSMRHQKQFVTHLIKKSVPFKPRLGKRTQQSMLCE